MAPVKRPINYVKNGAFAAALWAAFNAYLNSSQPFVDAFIAFVTTKYLPPISVEDFFIALLLGTILAGLAYRANPGF